MAIGNKQLKWAGDIVKSNVLTEKVNFAFAGVDVEWGRYVLML